MTFIIAGTDQQQVYYPKPMTAVLLAFGLKRSDPPENKPNLSEVIENKGGQYSDKAVEVATREAKTHALAAKRCLFNGAVLRIPKGRLAAHIDAKLEASRSGGYRRGARVSVDQQGAVSTRSIPTLRIGYVPHDLVRNVVPANFEVVAIRQREASRNRGGATERQCPCCDAPLPSGPVGGGSSMNIRERRNP